MEEKRTVTVKKAQNTELNRLSKKGVEVEVLDQLMEFTVENVSLPFAVANLFPIELRNHCNALLTKTEVIMEKHKGLGYNEFSYIVTIGEEEANLKRDIHSLVKSLIEHIQYKMRHKYKKNTLSAATKAWSTYIVPFASATSQHKSNVFYYFWGATIDQNISRLIVEPFTNESLIKYSWNRYMMNEFQGLFYPSDLDSIIGDSSYMHYLSNQRFEEEMGTLSDYPTNEYTADIYSDICEMYPVLLRGFKPNKNIIELPNGLGFMMIILSPDNSVLELKIATSSHEVIECRNTGKLPVTYTFLWDGTVLNGLSLWMPLDNLSGIYSFLVNQVYDALLPKYLSAIDGLNKTASVEESATLYTVWKGYLEANPKDHVENISKEDCISKKIQLPKMRRSKFFKLCESLGLCIEAGKGSELKIYRPGHRIYVIGTHGIKNDVIPTWLATKILSRAEVTPIELERALN